MAVDEISRFPDTDQHIIPTVVEVTMDIDVRVIHQLRVKLQQLVDVDAWFRFDGRFDRGDFGHDANLIWNLGFRRPALGVGH